MSLVSVLSDLTTRLATETKALRTLINGNVADLSSLTTTDKTTLVAALNEVKALVGAGSPTTLNDLTDVVITAAATGDIIRFDGTNWVDAVGTTHFQAASAHLAALVTAANSAVLAATTASFLTADETKLDNIEAAADVTDAANVNAAGAVMESDYNANTILAATSDNTPVPLTVGASTFLGRKATGDISAMSVAEALTLLGVAAASDTVAGLVEHATDAEVATGTDTVRYISPKQLADAINALIGGAPGTLNTLDEIAAAINDDANLYTTLVTSISGKQAGDAALTSIAGLTNAANKILYTTGTDTFANADISANGLSLIGAANYAAMRTLLSVYSTTEIGSITTDFVAIFEAGLV